MSQLLWYTDVSTSINCIYLALYWMLYNVFLCSAVYLEWVILEFYMQVDVLHPSMFSDFFSVSHLAFILFVQIQYRQHWISVNFSPSNQFLESVLNMHLESSHLLNVLNFWVAWFELACFFIKMKYIHLLFIFILRVNLWMV